MCKLNIKYTLNITIKFGSFNTMMAILFEDILKCYEMSCAIFVLPYKIAKSIGIKNIA
jgi:hypothetical protein